MPDASIIQAVTAAVAALPGHGAFRTLDLSCGDGVLLERLTALGCRAEGTHYREDDYIFRNPSAILEKAVIHKGVDLTRPLDFPDATYDLVTATEVLEHLPAHASLVAEVARILKPGGVFIFTTPNIHRLGSRLKFFFTGMHNLKGARLNWHVPAEDLYSTHHNPVYFPVMHTILHQQGLAVESVGLIDWKPPSLLLMPLYPLVALATWAETAHYRKRSREGGRDLLRWMLDPRLLVSEQLMVVARKG